MKQEYCEYAISNGEGTLIDYGCVSMWSYYEIENEAEENSYTIIHRRVSEKTETGE